MKAQMTDWNYRVPDTIGDICKVLRRRIEVHQQWADYISDNPDDPAVKQALASGIGAADNHLLYIRQYEAAIALIAADLLGSGLAEPVAWQWGAVTEAMVEAGAKAMHDGPLGANDEGEYTSDKSNRAAEWCRGMARAALTAALTAALGAGVNGR